MSNQPLHLQSSSTWKEPAKRENAELTAVMSMTVDDYARTLPRPKVLSWAERRAQYKPNFDATGLGFGERHAHYQRYLSAPTSLPESRPCLNREESAQASQERVETSPFAAKHQSTGPDAFAPSRISMPGQGLFTDEYRKKPTQYDHKNRIIPTAAGCGYGRKHRDNPVYTAAKQPRDIETLSKTLHLNSWL